MATHARHRLVDADRPLAYHVVSRCVRREWLLGQDPRTGQDHSHRKPWVSERALGLSSLFAVALDAFAVMSNHFHLVLLHDPKASERWRPETVARRYTEAFPPRSADGAVEWERLAEAAEMLLDDERRLARARKVLGSLSWFMRHLKQPIARRANREEGCTGHFFEQRFFSGPLRATEDVVATMCYVDLNPVRAGIAQRLEDCDHTSIALRLRRGTNATEPLRPLASGLADDGVPAPRLEISFGDYMNGASALLAEHLELQRLRGEPPQSRGDDA
ncbi:MAG: transposase [Gammaproteobacteria bacterium]|nr:transposase [Gammaproteobacteria bacterium]